MKCVRKVYYPEGYITRIDEAQKGYLCGKCKQNIQINEPNFTAHIKIPYRNSKGFTYLSDKRYCIHCFKEEFQHIIEKSHFKAIIYV